MGRTTFPAWLLRYQHRLPLLRSPLLARCPRTTKTRQRQQVSDIFSIWRDYQVSKARSEYGAV